MARKPKTKKQTFKVEVRAVVTVELDPSLLPDDEWREHFYPIKTLEQLAEHFAYNRVANGIEDISRLDGFADQEDSLVEMDVEYDEAEVIDD